MGATFHLFTLLACLFGVFLFLYGFFPLKKLSNISRETSDNIEKIGINRTDPIIGRLIFMVIDALRADFITGPNGATNMPYLNSLVTKNEACIFTARANPPTVTMPRIKVLNKLTHSNLIENNFHIFQAMVTGTVPGFVDVVLNLGSPKLTTESFVSNLVLTKEKTVFYGDDTWLRLFPNTFSRGEGTTSFFVTDYTEVDLNVTRHITGELSHNDWSLMILHYLGLDHIGHLVGPRSPLVQPKLMEMDAVIQQIHLAAPKEGLPQLLLVCGDHGMKDSGSHGGASQEETHVAVAAIGIPCRSGKAEINQVDLAPSLSLLLGLPEPAESIGTLISELLVSLSVERKLEVLRRNTQHLRTLLGPSIPENQESVITEATKLHEEWAQDPTSELADRIEAFYVRVSSDMSQALSHVHTAFDMYTMGVGAALLLQCTVLLAISTVNAMEIKVEFWRYFIGTIFIIALNATFCSINQNTSVTCSFEPIGLLIQVIVALILSYSIIKIFYNINKTAVKIPQARLMWFLVLGSLLHSLSLGASSFVEEEHQVWYFLWPTLLILLLQAKVQAWPLLVLNLVLHRLARKWNQTGDKWASLPDVEDYLSQSKNMTTLVFIIGIAILGCYLIKFEPRRRLTNCCYTVMLLLIYLYRSATGTVHFPYLDHHLSHQGWMEARLFTACLLVVLSHGTIRGIRNCSPLILTFTFRDCWLLGAALLRRPHDVVLLPVQLLASYTMDKFFCSSTAALVIAHSWLGWVAYFHQGNSNSLASVDLAAGYIGQLEYQPVLVGSLLLVHTYSAPVLSQALLLCSLLQHKRLKEVWRALRLSSVLRLLPMCVYLIVISLQREHLFVWSVFAPKLLYETNATFASFLTLLLCYLCIAVPHQGL
ncbi:hypothetical protein B566_EDAN000781 [Ephemera danica]|nr:hypothetical protein B566_EDAN000781 [Ephemera danica]